MSTLLFRLVFFLIVTNYCKFSGSAFPVNNNKNNRAVKHITTFDYLKKYGYLKYTDGEAAALYSEEAVTKAVKHMQHYGGLPQTGIVDDETFALTKRARCGVADVFQTTELRKRRFIIGGKGWNKRNITFYVGNWPNTLSQQQVETDVKVALETWGRYGRLSFKQVNDTSADIIIGFASQYHGDSFPFDGPGYILAHAYFPQEFGSYGGDAHFDADEQWTTSHNSANGLHFYSVALHELGHSLGLAHSPVSTSVMFPYYKHVNAESDTLDYDDILGMYELYIRRVLPEDTKQPVISTDSVISEDTTDNVNSEDTDNVNSEETDNVNSKNIDNVNNEDADSDISDDTTMTSTTTNDVNITDVEITTTTSIRNEDFDFKETTTTSNYEEDLEITVTDNIIITTTQTDVFKESSTQFEVITTDDNYKETIRNDSDNKLPNGCDGNFDAVATIRDELYIFKDQFLWRVLEYFYVMPGYPIKIKQFFQRFPKGKDIKINAAYERYDGITVLFIGNQYYLYNRTNPLYDSPRPITDYGISSNIDSIDAVHLWPKNGKTYLFKDDYFWRFNDVLKTLDTGYPMHMSRWRDAPQYLDGATTWKGVTYYFKGREFWRYDSDWMTVTDNSPFPAAPVLLSCPKYEELV